MAWFLATPGTRSLQQEAQQRGGKGGSVTLSDSAVQVWASSLVFGASSCVWCFIVCSLLLWQLQPFQERHAGEGSPVQEVGSRLCHGDEIPHPSGTAIPDVCDATGMGFMYADSVCAPGKRFRAHEPQVAPRFPCTIAVAKKALNHCSLNRPPRRNAIQVLVFPSFATLCYSFPPLF